MRYKNSILILVLLHCCSVIQAEQKGIIEVNSAVDTADITIGDRITYTVTIDHLDSLQIADPGPGANLGQFEI